MSASGVKDRAEVTCRNGAGGGRQPRAGSIHPSWRATPFLVTHNESLQNQRNGVESLTVAVRGTATAALPNRLHLTRSLHRDWVAANGFVNKNCRR